MPWAVWNPSDEVWRIEFRGKTVELPDLKNVEKYDFEWSNSGGSSSTGGEVLPYPKSIVKVGRALEDK